MAWNDGAKRSAEARATVLGPHGPLIDRRPEVDEAGQPVGPLAPIEPQALFLAALWVVAAIASIVIAAVRSGPHPGWWIVGGLAFGVWAATDVRLTRRALAAATPAPDPIEVVPNRRSRSLIGFGSFYVAVYFPLEALLFQRHRGITAAFAAAAACLAAIYCVEFVLVHRAQRATNGRLTYQPQRLGRNRPWNNRTVYVVEPSASAQH